MKNSEFIESRFDGWDRHVKNWVISCGFSTADNSILSGHIEHFDEIHSDKEDAKIKGRKRTAVSVLLLSFNIIQIRCTFWSASPRNIELYWRVDSACDLSNAIFLKEKGNTCSKNMIQWLILKLWAISKDRTFKRTKWGPI